MTSEHTKPVAQTRSTTPGREEIRELMRLAAVFDEARLGSDRLVGLMRGIRAVFEDRGIPIIESNGCSNPSAGDPQSSE